MKETIFKICADLCGRELAPDEPLIVSGLLDSFGIMELVCTLEDEFQIDFLPKEITNLDNFSSVNSIMDLVKAKLERKHTA